MKSMLRFLNRYTKECILAPLFKMLEASFELLVPLVMASIIDVGLANNDRTVIFTRCGLLLVLALVGLVCSITAQYFSARAAVGFASGVRHALFQKLQSLTFSDHDTIGASTLITRMTGDVNQTQTGVNLALRLLLRSPFVVFGAMIMAFTIDVRCALIFVGVIALLIVVVFGLMALNIPMMRTVRQALDKVLGATRETLGGARVLRAFCMEDSDYKAFVDKNRTLTEAQKRAGRVSGLMNPLTYLLINFAIVYLIHTGAVRVSLGALTPGMVVALYNYMSQILVELIKMANLIVSLNKAAACWKRIENILEMKPDMQSPAKPAIWNDTDEAVRFDHVSLRYRDAGAESLTDISFTVKRGQTFGIIGGTGAGKSSVVRLIPRFYDATSGTVSVFGEDVRNHSETTLRKHIGFVLQHADL
ncbi:MAG: ABC transporter ATP-binding protein, partial [Clostridia bacterium]|nr:ABC transporter ATP-binding protein [Clostridia bacterium]